MQQATRTEDEVVAEEDVVEAEARLPTTTKDVMTPREEAPATKTEAAPTTKTLRDRVVAVTGAVGGGRSLLPPPGSQESNLVPEDLSLPQYSPMDQSQSITSMDTSISSLESLEGSQNLSQSLLDVSEVQEDIDYKLPQTPPSASSLGLPVGGRLKYFVTQWKEMGASKYILDVLGKGYQIDFKADPTLTTTPCMESISNNPVKDQILEEQFQELLDKRVLEIVPGPYYGHSYFSNIFVVAKSNGKWRPVIDLKRLNKSINCPHFKMDDIQRLWETLLPGNFAFSIDLKDAYLHVPIHRSFRKYLRMYRRGTVYQFRALPFGLCTAPLIFTKIVAEVKRMVHLQGINMCSFLDDWIHQVRTFYLGQVQAKYMVELCGKLGWIVNMEKSELIPSQVFKFLGALFDLLRSRVFPTEDNLVKVRQIVQLFLTSQSQSAQMWQSLIGSLTSQQRFVYLGRLHVRPLQGNLMSKWTQGVDPQYQQVSTSQSVRRTLLWWDQQIMEPQGVPLVEL